MAGEIEEPFSLSFQADSIHSGSISFGRFEAESLSWERRSSFSHNRYLEEVEKYSKPGSVTEKKAYFEAHFKRKALLSQSPSDCQNGIEYQSSEHDTSENMGCREESEHINEGSHSVQFDVSFDGSEYDEDCEVMERERDDTVTSHVEPQFELALNYANVASQHVPEHVKPEKHQTGTERLPVIDAEPGKEVIENLTDKAVNVDFTCHSMHPSINSHSSGKDGSGSLEHRQESCPKVGAKLKSKLTKPKLNSPVNVTLVQRNIASEPSKDTAKRPIRSEREGSHRTKTEKQSLDTAGPTTQSVCRTSKPEDSRSSKSKVVQNNRSEKELKTKKVVEPKPSASEKVVPKGRQTANRPKQAENSTKSSMIQRSAVFNFKSDERAERRKEFLMKLEEKMHAKEAELNQILAKKLEKKEDEIKKFRKSLNFKATPMPSFYHEPGQCGSDKNKAVSSNAKSGKLKSKSSSPGSEAAGRYPKAGNDRASGTEHVNTRDSPQASAATNCSTVPSETSASFRTSSTNKGHPPAGKMNNEVTGKKKHPKENYVDLHKHRVSGSSRLTKGWGAEAKLKVEAGRSNNEMVRKDAKGVGISGASGMGHLAVGVAS